MSLECRSKFRLDIDILSTYAVCGKKPCELRWSHVFAKFIDSETKVNSIEVYSFHFIRIQSKYAQAKIKYKQMTESLTIEKVNIILELNGFISIRIDAERKVRLKSISRAVKMVWAEK